MPLCESDMYVYIYMCTYIYKYQTCINAYRYMHYIRSTNSIIAWRRCVYVCVDVCLLCEPDMYVYIYICVHIYINTIHV